MCRKLLTLLFIIFVAAGLASCASSPETYENPPAEGGYEPPELAVTSALIDGIMASYSGRAFADIAVADDLIDVILQCGQKAPSAINAQPWHFTVVKNSETAARLVPRDYRDGAAVIIISGIPDERRGVDVAFDCALATQNMYLAAQSLGLGAHIYYSGVHEVNGSMKAPLGVPDGYDAQMILLIGHMYGDVDGTTSATPRNPVGDNVNFID